MVYADTNFFIGLMSESDEHHAAALRLKKRYGPELETSLITIAELLAGCEERGLDPENTISPIFDMAKISGITLEEAMKAANYMKIKRLQSIDAIHAALAGEEIISFDRDSDMDKSGLKRISHV